MKTKNKLVLVKIMIFLSGAKDNNSSSAISNKILNHSGSKSESEEIINTINITPTSDHNSKNMKESA